jgi:hypothetical protein
VADYEEWFANEKRLRQLVKELESLSLEIVASDPRSPKARAKATAEPVDKARSESD